MPLTLPSSGSQGDPVTTLVSPKGLRRWRAALGKALGQQVGVVCQGDSRIVGQAANETTTGTAADNLLKAQRGWVAQLRKLLASQAGDPGEGWLQFGSDEGRWTYAGSTATSAAGPASTGRAIQAGGSATATGLDFSAVEMVGFQGSSTDHPARLFVDGTEVTPTKFTATQRSGTVSAPNWQVRGSGASVANVSATDGEMQVTATTAGNVAIQTPGGTSGFPVVPGEKYVVTLAASSPASSRAVTINLRFVDAGGTDIAVSNELNGGTINSGVGSFVQGTGIITVPAGAVFANVIIRGTALALSETLNVKAYNVVPLATEVDGLASAKLYRASTADARNLGAAIAAGTHALEVRGPVSGETVVAGVIVRKLTASGVAVHRIGKSGSTSGDHVGSGLSANTAANMLTSHFDLLPAVALRILELGANDFPNQATNSITPAVFRANLKILTDKQAALGGCTLLLADARYSNDAGLTNGEESYYGMMRDLATTDDHVAFLDVAQSWGTSAQAEALGFKNVALYGIHETLAGHGDLARLIFDALTRQALSPTP